MSIYVGATVIYTHEAPPIQKNVENKQKVELAKQRFIGRMGACNECVVSIIPTEIEKDKYFLLYIRTHCDELSVLLSNVFIRIKTMSTQTKLEL